MHDLYNYISCNKRKWNNGKYYKWDNATSHMTNDAGKLSHIHPYKVRDVIYVGDGNSLSISHTIPVILLLILMMKN